MGEGKCSPGPWKAIENSWQYTTIYDAHDREICRLDLERFEDLNEETQDKYESIQRADAAAIVRACDHDAALRRAKAEGLEQVSELKKALELYRDASYQGHSSHWDKTGGSGSGCPACLRAIELRAQARQIVDTLDARAAQIEEGE